MFGLRPAELRGRPRQRRHVVQPLPGLRTLRTRTTWSSTRCATSHLVVSGTSTTSLLGDDGDGVAIGVEADAFARDVVHHDGVE